MAGSVVAWTSFNSPLTSCSSLSRRLGVEQLVNTTAAHSTHDHSDVWFLKNNLQNPRQKSQLQPQLQLANTCKNDKMPPAAIPPGAESLTQAFMASTPVKTPDRQLLLVHTPKKAQFLWAFHRICG
ncbi:MAG: hypothetical protein GX564_13615 [Oligosphaeraceae bacterium]|nr:hypothetical protein [Oligosphaeraceae bacterium]